MNYDLIYKVYEYIRRQGYDALLQLQTNGTLIDREIAKAIKAMKIAIGVSLDGPPEVNEHLRGGTRQTVDGIQALAREGVIVSINSVVTAQNVQKLPELADFALYLRNVAGIGLDLLRYAGRAKESSGLISKPTGEQLNSALNLLFQRCEFLSKNFGRRIVIREIEEAKRRLISSAYSKEYCYASCGRSYVFLPNGDVYPCGSLIGHSGYYMGNIHNPPLKSISLMKKKAGKCEECSYYSVCPGGCPSRMIVNEDESQEETLDCILKKSAFDIASKIIRKCYTIS